MIGPGATGTVKAFRLVHRQQCPGAFELDALLAQRICGGTQGTPAANRRIVWLEHRVIGQLIRNVGRRRNGLIGRLGESRERRKRGKACQVDGARSRKSAPDSALEGDGFDHRYHEGTGPRARRLSFTPTPPLAQAN